MAKFMRRVLTGLAVVIVALVLGIGSAYWAVMHLSAGDSIRNGPWSASLATGSEKAGMYLRAHVALTGLFALNPSEAVYFSASTDSSGQPLRARCSYRIDGKPIDARWWSLTIYGDDNYLIANAANRFSFNMGNLPFDAEGSFHVFVSPQEQPAQWLPTGGGAGGFNLLFRLYNATPEVLTKLDTIALPVIVQSGECS